MILDETETQANQRMALGEAILSEISDRLKDFYRQKSNFAKKNIEFGGKYQQEIIVSFEEFEKSRGIYEKTAKEWENAEKKYDDALKKPKSQISALKSFVTGKDQAKVAQEVIPFFSCS